MKTKQTGQWIEDMNGKLDWHPDTPAQAQHSPLPWKAHQEGYNAAGWPIWTVFTPESALAMIYTFGEGDHPGQSEANAEFIVRACNEYESLKEELAVAKSQIENHEATLQQVRLNERFNAQRLSECAEAMLRLTRQTRN